VVALHIPQGFAISVRLRFKTYNLVNEVIYGAGELTSERFR